jgi:hypothetical protein
LAWNVPKIRSQIGKTAPKLLFVSGFHGGFVQRRFVEAYQCEKRLGVMSHGREAGDQRLHGAHVQERFGRDHRLI